MHLTSLRSSSTVFCSDLRYSLRIWWRARRRSDVYEMRGAWQNLCWEHCHASSRSRASLQPRCGLLANPSESGWWVRDDECLVQLICASFDPISKSTVAYLQFARGSFVDDQREHYVVLSFKSNFLCCGVIEWLLASPNGASTVRQEHAKMVLSYSHSTDPDALMDLHEYSRS